MSSPEPAKATSMATRATRTTRARATRATNGESSVAADEKVTVKTTVSSRKETTTVKTEVDVEEKITAPKTTNKRKPNGTAQLKQESTLSSLSDLSSLSEDEESEDQQPAPKKRKTATKPKRESKPDPDASSPEPDSKPTPKKKRLTKSERAAQALQDAMPLAPRTSVLTSLKRAMYIGAHVSAAGGVHNSVTNATKIGANAFALFLKSQRKWESPPLQDEHRDEFLTKVKEEKFDAGRHVLPHGSYLINLAQGDKSKADQAYESFIDDLRRCESLGIRLYNFHPGSKGGDSMEAACGRIAGQLNRAIKETKGVIPVLECMCGSGNVIGSKFEELAMIIDGVEDKTRVGVCIDTCHAFAAGYEFRTPEGFAETMRGFDEVVGLKYLKALHLNDSKAPFASHRDLHANIGTGFLGLRAFHSVMNYEPFQHLPMVLETPIEVKGPDGKMTEDKQVWADEIKLLESLIGADPDTPEFKAKEEELQARGAGERARIQEQVDKKAEKDAKKAENEAKKAAKKAAKEGKPNGSILDFVKKKAPARKKSTKAEESESESELTSCDSCDDKE
ncbi:xylose isomerase-like protein [Coniochaeta sp. 2T2.1]|nr:xylose isomerase-like protein [Coniochaeta sp. 2T2.1]